MAAEISLAGMDPIRFMESSDKVERMVTIAISREYTIRRDKQDENMAKRIANAVGRMIEGKRG